MNSPRRRLTFELLEPKASPSAILLALAPLDEPEQRMIESERAMYATTAASTASTTSNDANVALLWFIERNTRGIEAAGSAMRLPTSEQAMAADKMMQATDTDLRSMLITEMLSASAADGDYVCSVIQF